MLSKHTLLAIGAVVAIATVGLGLIAKKEAMTFPWNEPSVDVQVESDSSLRPTSKSVDGSSRLERSVDQQNMEIEDQEEEILKLAEEYELIRNDPEKRDAHIAMMEQKLASYSESVLPIAMEQMAKEADTE